MKGPDLCLRLYHSTITGLYESILGITGKDSYTCQLDLKCAFIFLSVIHDEVAFMKGQLPYVNLLLGCNDYGWNL